MVNESLDPGGVPSRQCNNCFQERRYTGVLKSVGGDYGFIACSETYAMFKRDVYVSKQVLEVAFRKATVTSGVDVSFLLCLNFDGQPNAKAVILQNPDEHAATDVFNGVIKYISTEKGFGFIECPEAFDLYGSDVHADLEALEGCVLGQSVNFVIRLGQVGGRPQAQNVIAAGPKPSVMPTNFKGVALKLLADCWDQGVLLFGEGDFSFAAAADKLHPTCRLDTTVYLAEEQWSERFPEHGDRITALKEHGHKVRFSVDAMQESCVGFRVVFFNFPHLSVTEVDAGHNVPSR